MPTGSCFCEAVQIEYSGEPQGKALCHCRDCYKISGSVFSTNLIVPKDGFKILKGKPKEFSKQADSGKKITNYFCGDCGTTLYRLGEWSPDAVILKAGVLDNFQDLHDAKPAVELFVPSRVNWMSQLPETAEKPAMP
ncbi:putative glutathione-dependent formaldehyde-activating enzyme-10 [Elsinoe australis]|uniref:Putative glutathione-dependent formaldehyde-activating enzyme-10 n=1 Tax=Elsinoe australis TaxID=40998 RepID=A0A4U7AM47_9PEZI|nr:putative glutathione-dependent formaldehyde-activating enzyme-10 [Elsinoe australis]